MSNDVDLPCHVVIRNGGRAGTAKPLPFKVRAYLRFVVVVSFTIHCVSPSTHLQQQTRQDSSNSYYQRESLLEWAGKDISREDVVKVFPESFYTATPELHCWLEEVACELREL